jgi:hypothetical protein
MQARDQDEWDDRDVQSQTEIEAKIVLRDSNKAAETTRIEQQQAAAQQQPVTNATQQNNSTVPVTGASRDEYTKIANERVIPGQPLSRDQLNVIGLSLASGNTYSPEITAQYRSQRPDGIGVPFIPPPSSQNPVTSSTGTTNATTPASQNDPAATYVSARTFADPAVQKEYDGFMRQQPSSSWNNASVQNDAAAFANAAVGEQAFQAENGSPARVAASQTAGDAVANTNGTTGGSQPVTPEQLDAEQQKILAILNANRVKQGLDPLDATSAEAANDIAELQQRRAALLAGDKNTGTSTGDFIAADALSSAEGNNVRTDFTAKNEFEAASGPTAGGYKVNISGVNQDSGTQTRANATSTVGPTTSAVTFKPTDNPLHAYASYTYGLSLHMLTPADYKRLVESPGTKFKPSITLISSANRYSATPPRDKAFADDFYFDNCKVTTNIGLSAAQRGTNALKIDFSLIEPYGMTFLNRLLDLSVRSKIPNYLDIPYLLEINFFGADDKGVYAKLDAQTKLIPIRIINIKIKAGTKGSEYAINAVPYSQMAHLESLTATKANFEISSRTVGDYFANGTASKTFASDQTQVQTMAEFSLGKQQAAKDDKTRATPGPAGATTPTAAPPATVKAGSFTNAFNLWQEYDVKLGFQRIADEIAFVIDPEISSAAITEPLKVNPARVATADQLPGAFGEPPKNPSQPTAANKPKPIGGDFTKGFFNINAGTNVVTVINNMVTNSDFIKKQLGAALKEAPKDAKMPETAAAASKMAGGPIQWFKIKTKIDLKEYDTKRGVYGKKITFYINKYTHYEARYPGIAKSSPKGSVKDYNYMYTGLNRDVIDFGIEFNSLFASLVTGDATKQAQLVNNPQASTGGGGTGEDLPGYSMTPQQIAYLASTMSSITGGSDDDMLKQRAANYAQNIYQGSQGDMCQLKLKILGDPQFIKQDEILWSPDKVPGGTRYLGGDQGSISMDSGEIHCKVNFKTPVDIDEKSGLLRKDSVWKDVYFSGFYQILMVESEFRQGKFTQVLDCIRPPQEGDSKAQVSIPTATAFPVSGTAAGNNGPLNGGGGSVRTTSNGTPEGTSTDITIPRATAGAGSSGGSSSGSIAMTDDEGNELVVTGDTAILKDTEGNLTRSQISGAPDRPGPDPLQQAARDNAATVDDYENAGMSSAPAGFPTPDAASADPNFIPLRNVAQNGPTGTIDTNSADTGEPIVGAPSASTQAAAPPQPAPVVNEPVPAPAATTPAPAPATQTPPVQTAPQPAPATATQRQSAAATAQLDSLVAQSGDLVKQYAALQVDYQPQLAKLQALTAEYDKVVKLKSQAENNPDQLAQLEVERARLYAASAEQRASMTSTRNELIRLSRANDDIGKQIAAIKANTTNEDAELNALTDAVDARQRATTKF